MTPEPDNAAYQVTEALERATGQHMRHRALRFWLRSLVWLALAVPLLLIADMLLHFSGPLRLAGTLGLLLGGAALTLTALVVGLLVRPPLLRVARLLEARDSTLGSKLVNILQLETEAAREAADPLTRDLARRAVASASVSVDPAALPPLAREPRLRRHALAAAVPPILILAATMFGGHHVRNQWQRFLDPFGDHPPFSLTRLEIAPPHDGEPLTYGESARIIVTHGGHRPDEVFLTAVPDDGAPPSTVPMLARADGSFAVRLEDITSPLTLTAHTAGHAARSHRARLELTLTPQFAASRVTVAPPAYTGLPPRESPYRFSSLQALEGSRIGFEIRSNRPLGDGSLTLESSERPTVTRPLAPADPETEPQTARAGFEAADSARLTFHLVDIDGHRATETPGATLTVTRDQPPAITIEAPEKDALAVDDLTIPLTVTATDDYGLSSIRLHVMVNDEPLPLHRVAFDEPGVSRHRLEVPLDLAALGVRENDRVSFFAEAVDIRPDPQLTRTATRRLDVISRETYEELIREQTDVARIAGAYESLVERHHELAAEQRRLRERLDALAERAAETPDDPELAGELADAFAAQHQLNRSLGNLADEMEDFSERESVYDFEDELRERVREQAEALRESVAANDEANERALEQSPPPPDSPNPETLDALAEAAAAQLQRLEGEGERAESEVIEPLAELARLHELMKNFTLFRELADRQSELAEQSKPYRDQAELNAEDRLALRELGAEQRELAPALEQLGAKLRADAEAAEEPFPEAAESARELADAIDAAAMPDLARRGAGHLLNARAPDGHDTARRLSEEMERLFEEHGEGGQRGAGQGLDRALALRRGMNPGDSFRQMLQSRLFRMGDSPGGGGGGPGGFMAQSAFPGESPALLGGDSFLDGPIANALPGSGQGVGRGADTGPTARLDRPDRANLDRESSRRTSTPAAQSLFLQYDQIADAYFNRLTAEP